MQRELVLQFPRKTISLTLFNQQSHTHNHSEAITMPPFSQSSGFLNCCSLPGSSIEVMSHNTPLLPSPQFSLSDAPFWGAQGGDKSPLLPIGVGPHWGLAPGLYHILAAIPGELVWPSSESSEGLVIQRVGTLVQKRTWNTVRWGASFFSGFLHSSPAAPPVQ